MPTAAEVAAAYDRTIAKATTIGDCLEVGGARNGDGYGVVRVAGELMLAHRLAFLHRHGYLPPVVRHTCDNPPCLLDDHHVASDQAANMADMVAKGRQRNNPHRGAAHPFAKCTPAQVRAIRRAHAQGATGAALARRYGLSANAVSQIVRRRRYADVA